MIFSYHLSVLSQKKTKIIIKDNAGNIASARLSISKRHSFVSVSFIPTVNVGCARVRRSPRRARIENVREPKFS